MTGVVRPARYRRMEWDGRTVRHVPARAFLDTTSPSQSLNVASCAEGAGEYIVEAMQHLNPIGWRYQTLVLALLDPFL